MCYDLRVGEDTVNIKKNTRILLARNSPVALVVGAASFFGANLVLKLLSKDIQVIGVDDLTFDKRQKLSKASENKNFHLVVEGVENLNLEVEKLDYIFIIPQKHQNFSNILDTFKNFKPRLLLISSIGLYDKNLAEDKLKWLKKIEINFAKVAKRDNLNARILRLGAVFGPGMDFDHYLGEEDPIIRLIQQSLTGDLQKDTSLEFSSRALFVDDACNLAVKCNFAGATAQKIFDGVLPSPIKVSDVKQVLLDPIWYETRHFTPSELPPWNTPNLEKTIKFLHWHPDSNFVESLKQTLNYFKDNEIQVEKLEDKDKPKEEVDDKQWKKEKIGELEGLKGEVQVSIKSEKDNRGEDQVKGKNKIKLPKFSFKFKGIVPLMILLLVLYTFVWPILQIGYGVLTFKSQLSSALTHLEKGEFEKSLSSVAKARDGIEVARSTLSSFSLLHNLSALKPSLEAGESLGYLATQSLDSAQSTILGVQNLFLSLKSITGELNESPKEHFEQARSYFASADEGLSKSFARVNSPQFKENLPQLLKPGVNSLAERLTTYSNLVKKGRALSMLLPEAAALDGKKTYLILLQNNNELRPTGGFIGSFAKVEFEGGRLKKLEVNDTYAIDGQLNLHVEPPKEIKEDLGQKDYFLRDGNFEPDFPTSARQIEWFYNKETGERVDGVVALDISAIEDLLSVLGTLDLPDYGEQITSSNLFEKAISHAEVNFFPGTQAKKSFLTALTSALFNKLFFLPNQNWPGIVTSLGRSLEHKHMSIYLDDPKLFSYVISQNWGGILPRPVSGSNGSTADFLAPVEANLGADKANYYLDRNYNLETIIGKDGEVSHRLRVSYTNRSPSTAFPAGKYKNRMRVYLPSGTKLSRALWGETDITKSVSNFAEYGREGYSFLIELQPKEHKTLVLDYQTPLKLTFIDKKATYRLDVVKQAGTLKDPFVWNITYPINVRLSSNQAQKIGPQQYSVKTDLSTDKTFKIEFTRP